MNAILKYPNAGLKRKTTEVSGVTPALLNYIQHLADLMEREQGVGIAAPQIDLSLRLFLVHGKLVGQHDPIVFINPEMLLLSDETDRMIEGCLSCPGVAKDVERSKNLVCRARDVNFDVFDVDAKGLYARVIQHEYDHLQGKLIADL